MLALACWALLPLAAALPVHKDLSVPSYLNICHSSDINLNTCIKDSINVLIKNIKDGSEEFGLPPTDPMFVPLVDIDQGSGNVSLHVSMRDVFISGFSLTDIISVKANAADGKLEIAGKTPFFNISGHFSSEGAVLSFPLHSEGVFYINMTDVTAIIIIYYQTVVRGNETFLNIENMDLDVIPSDIRYEFGKTLDGNNDLGEAMNLFLNENSHEIFNEVKPRTSHIFSGLFTDIGNQILSVFPEKVLLPP